MNVVAFPVNFKNIKDAAGRYFVSFVVEIQSSPLPQLDNAVGMDLGITTFATLSTGEKVNAAVNIKVAGGHSETQNGRGGKRQTIAKLAASCEASTRQEFIQLTLFD
ncbi:hypothetical protein [aff. Roholtiella sp. LEGE 12411]|uniref:hypothetical protein n=1 Tax=aff. Roholtiella sp. LEGE 12411 TaxID=1828822 RepID=UPI001ABD1E18|nr:hypothetical protein [aff. Roholtiella sp. LEGE 12411]